MASFNSFTALTRYSIGYTPSHSPAFAESPPANSLTSDGAVNEGSSSIKSEKEGTVAYNDIAKIKEIIKSISLKLNDSVSKAEVVDRLTQVILQHFSEDRSASDVKLYFNSLGVKRQLALPSSDNLASDSTESHITGSDSGQIAMHIDERVKTLFTECAVMSGLDSIIFSRTSSQPVSKENLTSEPLSCMIFSKDHVHVISEKLNQMKSLTYLDLSHNRLSKSLARHLCTLPLTYLDVSNSDLKTLPAEICNLKGLKTLNLSKNKLRGLPPTFSNLEKLESLNLSFNSLVAFPQKFNELSKLVNLDISYNDFYLLPKELCFFYGLSNLQLHHNSNLKSVPLGLAAIRKLNELNIEGTQISQAANELFSKTIRFVKNSNSQDVIEKFVLFFNVLSNQSTSVDLRHLKPEDSQEVRNLLLSVISEQQFKSSTQFFAESIIKLLMVLSQKGDKASSCLEDIKQVNKDYRWDRFVELFCQSLRPEQDYLNFKVMYKPDGFLEGAERRLDNLHRGQINGFLGKLLLSDEFIREPETNAGYLYAIFKKIIDKPELRNQFVIDFVGAMDRNCSDPYRMFMELSQKWSVAKKPSLPSVSVLASRGFRV